MKDETKILETKMHARTLAMEARLARLQRELEVVKAKEARWFVAQIKLAIVHYRLTRDQLFGETVIDPPEAPQAADMPRRKAQSLSKKGVIKYRDGGQTWTGRGRKPRWLVGNLAGGRRLEEFLV